MKRALKNRIKKELCESLKSESEIRKIIIFGSFLKLNDPKDIDLAIFQDSNESYLKLALKYRKLTRKISKTIPIDIIPLRKNISDSFILSEIEAGELIYERWNKGLGRICRRKL